MTHQLELIEDHVPDYRMDDETRRLGRRGVAEARAALAEARRRSQATPSAQRNAA